ncbi:MAG: sugar phosphate isomerase/epimerase family protein [Chloroflexota bacterium]
MRIGRKTRNRPPEEYFKEARELGFNWLELGCEAPISFPHTFDDRRIARIRDLRQKYEVDYGLHSASYVNSAEIMPRVREAVEQHLIEYIELAAKLKAEYLVIHCGVHFSQFMDETFTALLTTFRKAVEVAEQLDVPMVIENMNRLHPDCEINYLGTTIEELKMVFDAIDSPYLGLALDVGHAHLLPGGVDSFIDAFGPKLGGLHLHDNDGVLDRHWAMGSGTIDWPSLFARLDKMSYQGGYTIELADDQAALESQRYLKSIGLL